MPLASATLLGPYEIIAPIGAGGMGEVYQARDTRLNRDVAVKVLPAAIAADPERLRRFTLEAQSAGSLSHPNILAIFDIGTHEGCPYMVSELLEGETLGDRLRGGKLSTAKAIDYARQIASGLAAAHGKGIVHRDIKPENLFVTRDGRVKILDFGLAKTGSAFAKAADGETRTLMTDPGTVLGTMAYMSPEQVRGQDADSRSDIFSFGCVLYEMLAGERAFAAPTAADCMSAILHKDPLERLPAGTLPPGLERTTRHCLEKSPDERFQAARDLAFDLESASGTWLSSVAGQATAVERPKKARWRAPAIAAGVLLAVAGAWWAGRGSARIEQPAFQRLTFRRGTVQGARFTPDARSIIYAARWEEGKVELYSTQPGSPESRPLGVTSTGLLAISRTGEMAVSTDCRFVTFNSKGTLAQMPLTGGAPREVREDVEFADWTADGKQLAVTCTDPNGRRRRVEYPVGKTLYEATGSAWPGDVRLSSRGELAFVDHYYGGDDGYVAVLDQKGNKQRISQRFSSLQGLAWSPRGDEIWFTGATNGSIRHLYATTPAGKMRVIARMPGNLKLHDIAPDGRLLVTIEDARNSVYFMGPQDARPRDITWLDWAAGPILSADGKTIVFSESGEGAGGNSTIYLRGTDGSPAVRLADRVAASTISPDGKWVTANSNDDADARIVLLPTKAGNPVYLETGSLLIARVAGWLPDSQRIVFQANEPGHPPRMFVQEIRGGKPKPATREGLTGFAVTPDGSAVLVNVGENRCLAPLDGSAEKPLPALAGYLVAGFPVDGRSVYAYKTADNPPRIYRVDLTTGRADFWREIPVTDTTGLIGVRSIRVTPDGKSMAWLMRRDLSELYLVDGLK